jgi:hypothetical protein
MDVEIGYQQNKMKSSDEEDSFSPTSPSSSSSSCISNRGQVTEQAALQVKGIETSQQTHNCKSSINKPSIRNSSRNHLLEYQYGQCEEEVEGVYQKDGESCDWDYVMSEVR